MHLEAGRRSTETAGPALSSGGGHVRCQTGTAASLDCGSWPSMLRRVPPRLLGRTDTPLLWQAYRSRIDTCNGVHETHRIDRLHHVEIEALTKRAFLDLRCSIRRHCNYGDLPALACV